MTKNDRSLLSQMIQRGKFNWPIYDLLVKQNELDSKAMVKKMGDKWCCHSNNRVKRLDVPLPLLNDARTSKILKGKK
jgi:hypothetical protein